MWEYFKRILVSLDQLLNTLLGGYEDETLSSRIFRAYSRNSRLGIVLMNIVDTMFFFDTLETASGRVAGHCEKSYMYELQRMDLPPEMRG